MTSVQQKATTPRRLSPAALSRWRVCEQQFYFADVERIPRREQPNPLLAQGNALHAGLEKFFGLRPDQRNPAESVLHQALRNRWPVYRKPDTFASVDQEIEFGQGALALMSSFAANFDTTIEPLAREQWVSTRLPNGIELFGKIDRADPFEDGIAVIDYKTGRHQIEPEDLPGEPAAQVYLLAAEDEFGLPVRCVRYLYLQTGADVRWYPEREDIPAIAERLIALTTAIKEATTFPASPGEHCRWCPFALRCPDRGRVELADIAPAEGLVF
jgi:putative RecB family exonuclease